MISDEQVVRAVAAATDRPVRSISQVAGSVANQDFIVTLADGRRLFLKSGPGSELAAEAWACRALASFEVPVPTVIAVDRGGAGDGPGQLISTFVDGEPSEHPRVVGAAGRWIRRVHRVELPGWGALVVDPTGAARGRFPTWAAALHDQLSGLPELVAAGLLAGDVAAAARNLVLTEQVLGYADAGVLLHNDLKAAHLFAVPDGESERLTAIIDWGDAGIGDPAMDLARFSMTGPAATSAFLDGYGIALDDELDDRLARYRLAWNVRALSYEFRSGGDWFAVYRARIIDEIALLTR